MSLNLSQVVCVLKMPVGQKVLQCGCSYSTSKIAVTMMAKLVKEPSRKSQNPGKNIKEHNMNKNTKN